MTHVLQLQQLDAAEASADIERASSISIDCHTSNASGFSFRCRDYS